MAAGWQKILKMTVFGGFLDGQEIEFSRQLNCLIGGRGTGKSAVVELLRFALDCWPENSDLKRRSQEHIEAVLGCGSVTVTVQSPEGSIYKIKRQLGYKPQVLDNKGQPTGLEVNRSFYFPVVIFSQGELELMGDNPAARLALLDGMIAERKNYAAAIKKVRLQLEKIRPEAAVLEKEIQNLKKKTSLIPGLKERLKELESYDLDGLMARREQREQEIFWMRELYRGAQKKLGQLKNKLMETCLSFPEDYSNWVNADLMERGVAKFTQTMEEQQEQFNLLINHWKKLQDELKTVLDELIERHRNEEEQDRPVMAKFYGQKLAKAMEERREYTSTYWS
ncbi:MAG: AAA family ATPase [Desulfotomaculum sp.]|nr:AAA family ATPase [Desulfotomaculum sp.]